MMSVHGAGDPYLAAQLADSARRATRMDRLVFTHFLDPAQCNLALGAARKEGAQVRFWGGFEDAERRIAAFTLHEGSELDWPLCWLHCRWDARYASPQHRDLLGSLLGKGIERDNLGDLLIMEGQAFCAMLPEMASYLAQTLDQAGRATLRCDVRYDAPPLPEPTIVSQRETVASLRLDAVLSAGWNLSRNEAALYITQGKVRVDYLPEERTDARLIEGALVSVRGLGRFRLEEIGATTRKGRIGITLSHYR